MMMENVFNPAYFSNVSTQLHTLTLNANAHEDNQRGTSDFACCGYISDVRLFHAGFYPIHWHEEFQLTRAVESPLTIRVNSDTITLNPGELIFINSKSLHSIASATPGPCTRDDIIFEPGILYGNVNNVYYQKYFHPLMRAVRLPYLIFSEGDSPDIMHDFHEAFRMLEQQPFGFELSVRNVLTDMMLRISELHYDEIHSAQNVQKSREYRMRLMLDYISLHYMEPISLQDLAGSASISERECFRCFAEIMNTTPVSFIRYFRVNRATVLLEQKDLSVEETGCKCGFNTPAYFIRSFKEFTGMTPLSYRKKMTAHPGQEVSGQDKLS